MHEITAIIAEDERPQRIELRSMLAARWPELELVAECEDGLAALEALNAHRPRIAFLDIRMPGVSGLEVARVASVSSHVVFTTAYEEYAIEAFERGAIDYLLKPIRSDRLDHTIARLRAQLSQPTLRDISVALDELQRRTESTGTIRWITATAGTTTKLFSIEDVLFFQSRDKYTRVVTRDGEGHIRTPLRELVAGLDPEMFWQVHRSVIVRVDAIELMRRDGEGSCVLELRGSSETLPVSSAFQHRFKGM